MPDYAWAHLAHLFFAVIFVGGVFFEALVLSVMHTSAVSRDRAAKSNVLCPDAP